MKTADEVNALESEHVTYQPLSYDVHETPWRAPVTGKELVKSFYSFIRLTSKGGRKINQGVYACVTLSERELSMSATDLVDLISAKVANGRRSLDAYVQNYVSQRTGAIGYRGYFAFTEFENRKVDMGLRV